MDPGSQPGRDGGFGRVWWLGPVLAAFGCVGLAVLSRLRELGLFEEALIVVTADHGEEFRDHGGWSHTRTLYDELIRVLPVIKYPDGRRGVREDAVALLDVAPTLLDARAWRCPIRCAGAASSTAAPGEEERRQLRALGYLD